MKDITSHRTAKIWLYVGLGLGGLLLVLAVIFLATQKVLAPRIETVKTDEPLPANAEMKLLVMGDIYWGRYINSWSMASPLQYTYPFQQLNDFERDDYDAWIANLECPVTNNPKVSPAQEEATLKFDCSPAYLPEAAKWFTAVSLANNHTDNQNGQIGLLETKQHLEQNGIQYFGTFEPELYDDICEVVSLPARVTMTDKSVKTAKLPLALCGYHGVFKIPSVASVDTISRYSNLFNVISLPHSGQEYVATPDRIKTTLYRAMIDAGADVVAGGHPHWVQTSEAYKGKLIAYSLGNFIFDQQRLPETTRSAVLSITLSVNAADAPDIQQWLTLGETCSGYHDDCSTQAEEKGLKKLPFTYNFAMLGSVDDNKVTRLAEEGELKAIKERLDWQRTVSGLTERYSGQ